MSVRPAKTRQVEGVSPPPPGLEDLLSLVVRGDHDAYESVYAQMSGPVYGLVRKVLRDEAQSEEVAQEVLLHVWQAASRFDATQGSAMAWVMTIAHRRAVDRVRAEESRSRTVHRATERTQTVSYDEVAEEVTHRLEQQAVRECLAALTIVQHESVTLAYYGGLTYREVAEQLGIPAGTAKTRIRDGLLRLRDCLNPS